MRQILTHTAQHRARLSTAAVCGMASLLAAAPLRADTDGCLRSLASQLDRAGYSSDIATGAVPGPSIVDAVEQIAATGVVDVVVRVDGDRAHAVAPFLTHGAVRTVVQGAAVGTRACALADAVGRAAGRRHRLRQALAAAMLFGAMGAAWLGVAGGLFRTRSTARGSSRSGS